jgi:hypothetical protein
MVSPVLLAGLAIALLSPATASAGTIYTVNTVTGGSSFTAPYGKVTVNLVSSTEATVTLDVAHSGNYYYLFAGNNLLGLDFNVSNTNILNVSVQSHTSPPSQTTPIFSLGGSGNIDGLGNFNYIVQTQDTTQGVSQLVLDVTRSSGSWSDAAHVLVANSPSNGFDVAGHVIAYTDSAYTHQASGGNTFFAGDNGGVNTNDTPAPASAVLLGIGVLSLAGGGVVRRIRGRRPVAA